MLGAEQIGIAKRKFRPFYYFHLTFFVLRYLRLSYHECFRWFQFPLIQSPDHHYYRLNHNFVKQQCARSVKNMGKYGPEKNSVFGHFSRRANIYKEFCELNNQ